MSVQFNTLSQTIVHLQIEVERYVSVKNLQGLRVVQRCKRSSSTFMSKVYRRVGIAMSKWLNKVGRLTVSKNYDARRNDCTGGELRTRCLFAYSRLDEISRDTYSVKVKRK